MTIHQNINIYLKILQQQTHSELESNMHMNIVMFI